MMGIHAGDTVQPAAARLDGTVVRPTALIACHSCHDARLVEKLPITLCASQRVVLGRT